MGYNNFAVMSYFCEGDEDDKQQEIYDLLGSALSEIQSITVDEDKKVLKLFYENHRTSSTFGDWWRTKFNMFIRLTYLELKKLYEYTYVDDNSDVIEKTKNLGDFYFYLYLFEFDGENCTKITYKNGLYFEEQEIQIKTSDSNLSICPTLGSVFVGENDLNEFFEEIYRNYD